MTFVQLEYPVLLGLVLLLYWPVLGAVPGPLRRRLRNGLLLLASAVFYGWVHPWYLGLLAFSTLLDFGVGLGMAARPAWRRPLLGLSVVGNLGLLGTFKYLDFFIDNVAQALEALGFQAHLPTLRLALPVGISFFTFQTLSYTIDVYRGKLSPRRDLLDYATFVCLFPQLVAGPVERARDLLPQLEAPRGWSWERFGSGLGLALWGATKKLVVADSLALYVDRVFALHHAGPVLTWAATLAFAFQILADFSGYTDIARGSARMLGFELVENFRRPYLAHTPMEFWRRWHISFSSWIHEYVYIPLGGSERGRLRTLGARYGALLLSGLWHGAAWNFVLWGFFHASLLTVYKGVISVLPEGLRRWGPGRWLAVPPMFAMTCLGWLIFRQGDLSELLWALRWAPWGGSTAEVVGACVVGTLAVAGGLFLGLGSLVEAHLWPRLRDTPWALPARTLAGSLCLLLIVVFARDTAQDFIYFRF